MHINAALDIRGSLYLACGYSRYESPEKTGGLYRLSKDSLVRISPDNTKQVYSLSMIGDELWYGGRNIVGVLSLKSNSIREFRF